MECPLSSLRRTVRGMRRQVRLSARPIRYAENGQRSVPIHETIGRIEHFFLKSPIEIQFAFVGKGGRYPKACLKYHSPFGVSNDQHFFGKGISTAQNFASACFEFFERYDAQMRPDDRIQEASFNEVAHAAVHPREFVLAPDSSFRNPAKIDWIWGFSLTRKRCVLVPANLVFLNYAPSSKNKIIAPPDSNGIAAGNNREEAVLHALLEVIERDLVIISEYNRFPVTRIAPGSLPDVCRPILERLQSEDIRAHVFSGLSDLPFPFIVAMLQYGKDASACTIASGSCLNPTIALERALTEAVQMLPPGFNLEKWQKSGMPQFYMSHRSNEMSFNELKNLATSDIKKNIEKCVSILSEFGSEVLVVDLSHPDIPFPTVRVLATRLQPVMRRDSMRLSRRFFDVPVKLGLRNKPRRAADVKFWPLCGYK